MEIGQRLLLVLVLLILFAPLAYATNFLFGALSRKWGVVKFMSALSAFTFVSFIFYVWLFLRFRMAGQGMVGLGLIYLILLAQTVAGVYRFRNEFRESLRNTMNGFRKK